MYRGEVNDKDEDVVTQCEIYLSSEFRGVLRGTWRAIGESNPQP